MEESLRDALHEVAICSIGPICSEALRKLGLDVDLQPSKAKLGVLVAESAEQTAEMRDAFGNGIAWGEAKKQLFELVNKQLEEPREKYMDLIANPGEVEAILRQGATKARLHSTELMMSLRQAVGLRRLG
jgi:hypothetical protein